MLTASQIAQRTLTKVLAGDTALWQPDPDNAPQCLAYELADVVDELGYGGRAGGGKTDIALGLAGTKFTNSLILRREFPQLEGIIDRGNEIYPTHFVGGYKKRWEYGNSIITLGSIQHEKDWRKYQGRARQFIAFDEASELLESTVRKVTGWVRAEPGVKTLVLYTFNPPTTPEGEWIIEYFAPWIKSNHPNPAQPGEIRWFAYITDERGRDVSIECESGEPFEQNGVEITPISRTYIPASRHDNKYLGKDYERRLNALPEPLRTKLRDGDMNVRTQDHEWQVIPTLWVLEAQNRWEQARPDELVQTALGVDVARGGADETVIAPLYGDWFGELVAYPGALSPNGQMARDQVLKHHRDSAVVAVDIVGIGSSAFDHLTPLRSTGLKVMGINAGAAGCGRDTSGQLEFLNLRAKMYWQFREALDPNSGKNIALPPDPELRRQLTAATYTISGKKIKIEPKPAIKKRIGRSPDKADAVVMAYEARSYRPPQLLALY